MNFQEMVNSFVLGRLLVDDLPIVAAKGIQCGYASPALYELADSIGSDSEHLRKLFFKSMEEIELRLPSADMAAMSYAKMIAKEVLEGRLSPYHGASRIWGEISTHFPKPSRLRVFVGLASEYEDDEFHRAEYTQRIIEECKCLLESAGSEL